MRRVAAGVRLTALGLALGAGTFGIGWTAEAQQGIALERPGAVRLVHGLEPGAPWPGCALIFEADSDRPGAPSQLSLWCPAESEGQVRVLADELPEEILAARWASAGDGGGWLEVGHPEGVALLCPHEGEGAALRACGELSDPRLAPTELAPGPDLDADGSPELVQSVFDGLAAWARPERDRLQLLGVAPLPVQASASPTRVSVRTAPLLGVARHGKELAAWTAPEHREGARMRLHRIPLGPEGPGESCTAWIRTEEPSRAIDSVILPGAEPRLASLIQPSERLALLNEQRLMIAPLECDPTRRGNPPEWVDETPLDNYLASHLLLRDVTGDDRPDLVAIGVQGRLRPRVRVEVHPADGEGGWATHGDRWLRERVEDPPRYLVPWDRDLTGDGVFDLALLEARRLVVVPGSRDENGEERLDWEGRLVAGAPLGGVTWLTPTEVGGPIVAVGTAAAGRQPQDDAEETGDTVLAVTLHPAE